MNRTFRQQHIFEAGEWFTVSATNEIGYVTETGWVYVTDRNADAANIYWHTARCVPFGAIPLCCEDEEVLRFQEIMADSIASPNLEPL